MDTIIKKNSDDIFKESKEESVDKKKKKVEAEKVCKLSRRDISILNVLNDKKEAMYGYKLIEFLQKEVSIKIKGSTLYNSLLKLENYGLLESFEKIEKTRLRKYYRVTTFGGNFVENRKKEDQILLEALEYSARDPVAVIGGE